MNNEPESQESDNSNKKPSLSMVSYTMVQVLGVVIVVILLRLFGSEILNTFYANLSNKELPSKLEIASDIRPQSQDKIVDLTVEYASHFRPNSSARIDLLLESPAEVNYILPVELVSLPSPITPTLNTSTSYSSQTIVSEEVVAILTSPTFIIETIYPDKQKLTNNINRWSWNVTSPETLSSGVLTLRIYKIYDKITPIQELNPTWVGTIPVDVIQFTPTPTPLPIPSITPEPSPTLESTPTLGDRAVGSIVDNAFVLFASILTLIGVFITAIWGPMIIERWKQQNHVKKSDRSIIDIKSRKALETIKQTEDIEQLKLWRYDEEKVDDRKRRNSVIKAIDERISQLQEKVE